MRFCRGCEHGLGDQGHVGIADLDQAAQLCAIMYYEHVALSGPLLHILMTDLYMKGHI